MSMSEEAGKTISLVAVLLVLAFIFGFGMWGMQKKEQLELQNEAIRLEIQKLELQKEVLEIEGIHKEIG